MNTIKNQIDDLNFKVTLEISKDDYAAAEKKKLSECRRKADFKGFRKGNVPMSLVQRVYGEQCLYEAVNESISEGLNNFVRDEKIRMIGEPLASEDQPQVEWKSGNDFSFNFDIAQSSELTFVPSEKDKLVNYTIDITSEAKQEMKENMLRQFGDLQDAESAGEEDFVIADLSNESKTVEDAYISVRSVDGEDRAKFVGAKPGDQFDINVNEAFKNESDRAAMLKVKKEELASLDPLFHVSVVNVRTFVAAEENQETYDKIFGEDQVHNSDEFDKAVTDRLADNYKQESDYRLSKDIKNYFLEKADIKLPETFLKRWLFKINEGKFTMEDIEKEFDSFLEDYRWQMVRDYLMDMYKIKVDDKDLQEAAESYVRYQYAMYGLNGVPQDMIKDAVKSVLSDERQARNIWESVQDNKVIAELKNKVSYTSKNISVEKFRELK